MRKEFRTEMSWRALFMAASCLTWLIIAVFASEELTLLEVFILPRYKSLLGCVCRGGIDEERMRWIVKIVKLFTEKKVMAEGCLTPG